MWEKIVVEVLNDASLRSQIKIDQHVAAKDDIHTLHERHAGIVGQIEPAEADVGAAHRIHLELLSLWNKVFLPIGGGEIARAVIAVDGGFGVGQRALVEIGCKN